MNVHVHEDAQMYTSTICISMRVYYIYISLAPIQDYVSQESAWSSDGSTCQRKYLATSKVFVESIIYKTIYISMGFQISEWLR